MVDAIGRFRQRIEKLRHEHYKQGMSDAQGTPDDPDDGEGMLKTLTMAESMTKARTLDRVLEFLPDQEPEAVVEYRALKRVIPMLKRRGETGSDVASREWCFRGTDELRSLLGERETQAIEAIESRLDVEQVANRDDEQAAGFAAGSVAVTISDPSTGWGAEFVADPEHTEQQIEQRKRDVAVNILHDPLDDDGQVRTERFDLE